MFKSLNVLIINYEYPPVGGGGGVLCQDVAEELVRSGHRVTVITSGFKALPRREIRNGVEIHRVPVLLRGSQNAASMVSMLSYVPLAIRKARELLWYKDFDVINTYFAIPSGPAGHYLAKRYGIPNVLYLLGGDVYDPSKFLSPHKTPGLWATVKKVIEGADGVIALSSDIRDSAARYFGVTRSMEVIPAGIRPFAPVTIDRAVLGLGRDKLVLATVGRLVRRKNIEELLEIFSAIRERHAAELVIIGDGPERDNLKARIAALRLNGSVKMPGRVTDAEKIAYLAASDGYVSTAQHEGFGIVFLEAMEAGLPVVAYDEGGQTDFLKDGCTGYVVKAGDKEALTQRLEQLARDTATRDEMRTHNREYVKRFHIDRCCGRVVEMFQRTLARVRDNAMNSGCQFAAVWNHFALDWQTLAPMPMW